MLYVESTFTIPSSFTFSSEDVQITVLPFQLHSIPLSLFASVMAPFGGFLASGIKRAYKIKDFDSFIPGHGGIMDRMDCQFLMALCTWVHVSRKGGRAEGGGRGGAKGGAPKRNNNNNLTAATSRS